MFLYRDVQIASSEGQPKQAGERKPRPNPRRMVLSGRAGGC